MTKTAKQVYIVGFLPDDSEYASVLVEGKANLVESSSYPDFYKCEDLSFQIFGSTAKDLSEKELSEIVDYFGYEEFQVHNRNLLLPKASLKEKGVVSTTKSKALVFFSRTRSLCYYFVVKTLGSRPTTRENMELDNGRDKLIRARLKEVIAEDFLAHLRTGEFDY